MRSHCFTVCESYKYCFYKQFYTRPKAFVIPVPSHKTLHNWIKYSMTSSPNCSIWRSFPSTWVSLTLSLFYVLTLTLSEQLENLGINMTSLLLPVCDTCIQIFEQKCSFHVCSLCFFARQPPLPLRTFIVALRNMKEARCDKTELCSTCKLPTIPLYKACEVTGTLSPQECMEPMADPETRPGSYCQHLQ